MSLHWGSCKLCLLIVYSLTLMWQICCQFDHDDPLDRTNTINGPIAAPHTLPINTTTQLEVLDDKSFGGIGARGERFQRKTKSGSSNGKVTPKSRSRSDLDDHDHKPKADDDNYHVRYETKFGKFLL